ncbi:MAG: TIGR02117 family protein [Planctomycetota bacterium]
MKDPALESTNKSASPTRRSLFQQLRVWGIRCLLSFFSIVLFYLTLCGLGLYPVNQDYVEPAEGVDVFVLSGAFHSDIIFPIQHSTIDWRTRFPESDFELDTKLATHIGIGWGDRNFYLHTPTWNDLKFSTAANALLWPSETVTHISMISEPIVGTSIRRVRVSTEDYEAMVDHVLSSFAKNETGNFEMIPGFSYTGNDAFYRGTGSYHVFRTCNCWVGETMRAGGIKCGWFTPLPRSVFFHLPNDNE